MYCKNCGNELQEGTLFCSKCGCAIETSTETIENPTKESPKIWNIFAKAGHIGGIICLICSFIPFFSLFASGMAINFIVLSALGKKTNLPEYYWKATKGLQFSIAATIIGFVAYFVFFIVILSNL